MACAKNTFRELTCVGMTGNMKTDKIIMTTEQYLNSIIGGVITVLLGVVGYVMSRYEKRITALEEWRLTAAKEDAERSLKILNALGQVRLQNEYLTKRVDEIIKQLNE